MGAVYLGVQLALERRVAVKVLSGDLAANGEFVARFEREARTLAQLTHPHMVQVHFAGHEAGRRLLVMEYVEGCSLAALLDERGSLEPGEACDVVAQAAEALTGAWARGIVHRDIKPDNLLVGPDGLVKVADFGLARRMVEPTRFTGTGDLMGTPHYMSPEQCRGEDADVRSDIYSLGITFWECLAGQPPFRGPTPYAVIHAHLTQPLPDLRREAGLLRSAPVPGSDSVLARETAAPAGSPLDSLAAVIGRMTEKRAEDRYQDPAEVVAAVEPLAARLGGRRRVRPATAAPAASGRDATPAQVVPGGLSVAAGRGPGRQARRRGMLALLGLALLAAAGVAIGARGLGSAPAGEDAGAPPAPAEDPVPGLLEEAGGLWAKGDAAGAAAKCRKAMAGRPSDADLEALRRSYEAARDALDLADSWERRGDLRKAAERIDAAVQAGPPPAPHSLLDRASELGRRAEGAEKEARNRERAQGWLDIARQHRVAGAWDQAIDAVGQARKYLGDSPESGGDEARKLLEEANAEESLHRHLKHRSAAEAAAREKDFEKAIREYTAALGVRDEPSLRAALGEAERLKKEADEALRKRGIYESAWTEGESRRQAGQWPEALAAYREASAHAVDAGAEVAKRIAECRREIAAAALYSEAARDAEQAAQREDWEAAESAWKRALEARPRDETASRRLAGAGKRLAVLEIWLDDDQRVKLTLVRLPAGTYTRGSPVAEPRPDSDEPPHQVTITRPFYLQTTEVTQAQWEAVMGVGSKRSEFRGDPNLPVVHVSRRDCGEFLRRLAPRLADAGRPGLEAHLPTEAEWEYACRAGSGGRFCFGDDESRLGEYAWFSGSAGDVTHRVGERKANEWGLFDMHGNVFEWCRDGYAAYPAGAVSDPAGPESAELGILRGGSFVYGASHCRSADRVPVSPDLRARYAGFRVAAR